jgi:hypothetical protein
MTDPQDPFAPPPSTPPSGEPAPGHPAPPQPYGAPAYGAPAYGAPAYGEPAYGEPLPYGAPMPPARNGFGTWSLVLGLLSLFCLFVLVVPAGLAVVFGVIGRGRVKRREATNGGVALAGVITGSVALVAGVALWGFVLAHGDAVQRFRDCVDNAQGSSAAQQACSDQFSHDLFGTSSRR